MAANWIDQAISYVSPLSGLKRARARHAAEILRAYEGASKGRRTKGWRTSGTSANTEISASLPTLRNRSRDLVRNNPFAARGVQVITSNTVGDGIIPQTRILNPTARNPEVREKKIQNFWEAWGDRTVCDADGRFNFYGLQSLVMRTVAESGEALIRRRRRRDEDGLPIPLQIQVLEPDFIDSAKEGVLPNGNYIVHGIEFDMLGKRVAYHLFSEHPGGSVIGRFGMQSFRIPAEEIIHVYRLDRPGQVRGVPWLAPVMIKLREFDEYEDAQLVRQKIATCFAGIVYDGNPEEPSSNSDDDSLSHIQPGTFQFLPPGKDIKFPNVPAVDGYADFSRLTLIGVATGLGITYESMTGDLGNVNFSSGRMGWIEMFRNINQWRWHMLIPHMCDQVYQWFLEAVELKSGMDTSDAMASWTEPKREMIDPVKEIKADIEAVLAGQTTLSEVIRGRGYDPKQIFVERQKELALLDELGIVTTSDPRHTLGQKSEPKESGEEEEGDQ